MKKKVRYETMESLVVCAVDFFQPAEECGVRACVRVKCVQKNHTRK